MDTYRRVFIAIFAAFALAIGCFGVIIIRNTGNTMRQQLGSKCAGIASAVAVLIENDTKGYRAFCQTLDTDSEYYEKMRGDLRRIRLSNADSIAYLYTEMRISTSEMMYILDAEDEDSPGFSPPGKVDRITAPEYEAYQSRELYIAKEFVTNDYGTLLTCYAPVFDRETGSFLGLVGTDVSIDQYNAIMRGQIMIVATSVAILVLAVAFTIVLTSGRVVRMITTDGLTGAYNKAYFLRNLRRHIRSARKKNAPVIVFMADLDLFKSVNDKYGHPFGDVVLAAVAREIARSLRKTDCLARYGGEEFSAYLLDVDSLTAKKALERIRMAIAGLKIHNAEYNEDVAITISIGATKAAPGQTAAEVIEMADKALYHAKKTRNTVAFHSVH